MKYKIQTLEADSHGNIDIPDGWIPLGYGEVLEISTSKTSRVMRRLTALEPIKED